MKLKFTNFHPSSRSWFFLAITFTLLTSFSTAKAQDDGAWGNLKGSLIVKGDAPAPANLKVEKDKAACLIDGQPPKSQDLIVGANGEFQNVYVMMYFKKSSDKRPTPHPDYAATKSKSVTIDNVKCMFDPPALFVQTGQKLTLKNSDGVGHNCHIKCFNNEENINLSPGGAVDITLKNTEKAPGIVSCDIHPWMSATILIRDEPYATLTGSDGSFQIDNIPAGTWKFQFWHKKAGYLRKLEVPGHKVGRKGDIEVTIKKGETLDLGQMIFPATAFKK